ncbi:hypothetical protein [Flavisolibacter tropicus]|uniref:Uncharacterized protein n=1 Tax=Flavisolibacter tropicus TaxID=1492898 RepID=A0A172TTY3_9BACT|nr:hypothetical protein [Flavisolibacter tropicus]ANE50446.1 hypothetical protein SY85_08015 [Flavisolibacter tropicus]
MDSYVAYNLWGFFVSVLLLIIFIYFFVRLYYSPRRDKAAFITALSTGIVFIFLIDYITYGWTSYPPLASLGISQLTEEKYNLILLVIKSIMAIAIVLLFFRWYKLKNSAANTGSVK